MDYQLVVQFLLASVLLTVIPGPDNIFVLTESLTKGVKQGIAISMGLVSGVLVHTLAAATGLSIIIQQSAMAFQIIKYLGAAYLLYLAYKSLREKREEIVLEEKQEQCFQWGKLFRKGFLMNVLNPKVSLFFIAFLPRFVDSASSVSTMSQMIVLGILFMIQAFIIFSLVSLLSGRFSKLLNNERFWKGTKWGKVSVLTTLGLLLAFSKK